MAGVTFDQTYFDNLYRDNPDPWDFRSSAYERAKYAATLEALPRERYKHAIELGCSIGELTCQLAHRTDALTAVDTSAIALAVARTACREATHIDYVQAHVPDGDWTRPADLVVLSEILYYLDAAGVRQLAARIQACAPDADLILVHWTGETNYPLTGDDATAIFLEALGSPAVTTCRAPAYRLDIVQRSAAHQSDATPCRRPA